MTALIEWIHPQNFSYVVRNNDDIDDCYIGWGRRILHYTLAWHIPRFITKEDAEYIAKDRHINKYTIEKLEWQYNRPNVIQIIPSHLLPQ